MRRRASFFIIFYEQAGKGEGSFRRRREATGWYSKEEGEGKGERDPKGWEDRDRGKSRSIIMLCGDQNHIPQEDTGPYQKSVLHLVSPYPCTLL